MRQPWIADEAHQHPPGQKCPFALRLTELDAYPDLAIPRKRRARLAEELSIARGSLQILHAEVAVHKLRGPKGLGPRLCLLCEDHDLASPVLERNQCVLQGRWQARQLWRIREFSLAKRFDVFVAPIWISNTTTALLLQAGIDEVELLEFLAKV